MATNTYTPKHHNKMTGRRAKTAKEALYNKIVCACGALFVLVCAIGIFGAASLDENPGPTTETPPATVATERTLPMPDVSDTEFNDALLELYDYDLRVERVDSPSADVPAGFVIDTDPPTGSDIAPGDVIVVVVSAG